MTKSRCTVRTSDGARTATFGEVLYLFAGTPGTLHTDEDTELVYVASSPYGEVKAELLGTQR